MLRKQELHLQLEQFYGILARCPLNASEHILRHGHKDRQQNGTEEECGLAERDK